MINTDYKTSPHWDGEAIRRRDLYKILESEKVKVTGDSEGLPIRDWHHHGLGVAEVINGAGILTVISGIIAVITGLSLGVGGIAIAVDGPFIALGGAMVATAIMLTRYYLNQKLNEKAVEAELAMIEKKQAPLELSKSVELEEKQSP